MKILFFSPNAFIDVHAVPEALVAQSLKNRGHQILYVNCDGILKNYCISMNSAGLEHGSGELEKNKICTICKYKKEKINNIFKFQNVEFDKYIEISEVQKIDEITKLVNQENWFEFTYKSIPIGRYAAYELVLNDKINNKKFNDSQWNKYKIDLKNALIVYFSINKIFDEYHPDRVIIYNNLYSANSVVSGVAHKRGVPYYSLHAGGHHVHRLSQMTIFRDRGSRRLVPFSDAWKKFKDCALSKDEIDYVNLHLKELLRATSPWVYSIQSTNKKCNELHNFFQVKEGQKVLLITMSSEDEKFAGSLVDVPHQRSEPIFSSYFEWINFLVDWAQTRPEVKLIIRVHPREFPNKREAVLSEQATILTKYFINLPSNVIVNWPSDNVSLYDLFKIVDVGLNSSSTAGLEMSLFGIPVVILDENQLIPYPRDLNIYAENKKDYLKKIDETLNLSWSLSYVIKAYRWLSFINKIESIDISDGYFPIKKGIIETIKHKLFNKRIIENKISTNFEFSLAPVKNEHWLVWAIERGEISHLDEIAEMESRQRNESISQESLHILKNVQNLYKKLSDQDKFFQKKIKHLYKN